MLLKNKFKISPFFMQYTEDEIRKEERIIEFTFFNYPYIDRFNQAGIY